jgi:hypothetical protein
MRKSLIRVAVLFIILETGLSSCKKMEIVKDAPLTTTAKTTLDIKAPNDFKWKTTSTFNLTIKPTEGDGRVEVLKLTFDDGVVLYQKLQKASISQNILLEIPSQYSKVNLSFGSISKVIYTKNSNVVTDLK